MGWDAATSMRSSFVSSRGTRADRATTTSGLGDLLERMRLHGGSSAPSAPRDA
jgi:hypothetical protein